ncbi:hypothetical protein PTSG_08367 [Salpingoeca rosetta]|uniref:Cytochrome c oxidase subunit IV n=1 Tax=Salpingoeca rosetta (strain ATCC 50818 / BSB-021) TaxID=946362 RepID=F2UJH4_SALR5|nr:uncharacterized protein PTSG_08367 [Salpingoeca rosetta]EGD77273.1 hypothetical protein PTSG_08367 [Salpingoeca rosetta]|eukprot:XP_004990617.1 hypothetical protein PTSG_08367 [Salpingoeca rosetta]
MLVSDQPNCRTQSPLARLLLLTCLPRDQSRHTTDTMARRLTSVLRMTARRSSAVAKASEGELTALKEKEKLPWGQLTNSEKTQLYRAAYGKTRKEMQKGDGDGVSVMMGVGIGLATSFILFKLLQSRGQPAPKTMTAEWKQATKEKIVEGRNANPIHNKNF